VRFDSEKLASDDFNIYGGWWQDENTASFYFNNGEARTMQFNDSIKARPFDQPMGLNLVAETYPVPWIELPNDEELADPAKNICYYDWVRVYDLVDVDAPSTAQSRTVMFDEVVAFAEKPGVLKNGAELEFLISYKANADRELCLEILDANKEEICSQVYSAIGGYGRKVLRLDVKPELNDQKACTARIFIRPKGAADNDAAYDSDEFSFVVR